MASAPPSVAPGRPGLVRSWIDRNFLALGREMRLSYLPPLMIYVAAGISGLTSIVATFYVKERVGLSAEFLAGLGFWAGLPWALKVPLGHLVDLIWRWKAALVFVGAGLITASLAVMIGFFCPHPPVGAAAGAAWGLSRASRRGSCCPHCSRRSATSCRTWSPTRGRARPGRPSPPGPRPPLW